ncbi:hypothetical protein Vretifemale_10049 [Volvox reticuliferus]|uniref:Uncharacterized protein n=1 Tax=Volvox reticuliferus TaxID=1737510 RepID=A0A8J4FMF1_9CHLO|nr:hypothetical protein Vretifemale_10049 [Volvox reticuliferus]
MDAHTPVGSLDTWLLDRPKSAAPTTALRSANDALRNCGKEASAPMPIPRTHNARAVNTRGSLNPETCSSSLAPWVAQRGWLGEEAIHLTHMEANLSSDLVREGTVRRGRHLDMPSPLGQHASITLAPRDPGCMGRWEGVVSTAASLPLFTTREVSPMSLASLCRALSSPAQRGETLAFPATDSVTCATKLGRPLIRQCSVLPSPSVGSVSASEPSLALGGTRSSITASPTPVTTDRPTWAVCERACPADGLVGIRAESTTIPYCGLSNRSAAATAACELTERPAAVPAVANVPVRAGLSTKRGLYEGTVRGGSTRNTWRYIGCCTAAG